MSKPFSIRQLIVGSSVKDSVVVVGDNNSVNNYSSDYGREETLHKLLMSVKREVKQRLATSLHELVKLDLFMEDQHQRVGENRLALVPEDSNDLGNSNFLEVHRVLYRNGDDRKPLPIRPTQKIVDVFKRSDIKGKLLILGEPGSGKTTELLHLAKDLIKRAEQDPYISVPIVLELSTWHGESIFQWVESQLQRRYLISAKFTRQWLKTNQLLLLLDGLDELGLKAQRSCVEAINYFLETAHVPELVVCCRREEYEIGQTDLGSLRGAIYLEELRDEQIWQYFKQLNRLRLWTNLRANPTLMTLARKPLFLFMLVVAYQGSVIRDENDLFNAYIQKQLYDPINQGTYKLNNAPSPDQTKHYLVWLANRLEEVHETEFLIEQIQPSWLKSYSRQFFLYRLFFGLVFGMPFALSGGLLGISMMIAVTPVSILVASFFVLIFGAYGTSNEIQPIEKLKINPQNALVKAWLGVRYGGALGAVSLSLIYAFFGALHGAMLGPIGGILSKGIAGAINGALLQLMSRDRLTPSSPP